MWAVDDSLPFIANILCASLVGLLGTAILLATATPLVLLLYIPTAVLYFFVQRYYRRTSREVKRLDSASRSPVYSHFSQSLLGATTLVSFAVERCVVSLSTEFKLSAYYLFGSSCCLSPRR